MIIHSETFRKGMYLINDDNKKLCHTNHVVIFSYVVHISYDINFLIMAGGKIDKWCRHAYTPDNFFSKYLYSIQLYICQEDGLQSLKCTCLGNPSLSTIKWQTCETYARVKVIIS